MLKNFPLVSVIVPNYNHEKYLKQRLDSIFNQTYPNFEVILLDDCSTDNSTIILSEYANNKKVSHCIFNQINTGNTFIQWDKGIALAKGDYIWIAESDDFCDSIFLEEVCKPLIKNPDIVLSYCQSNRVNENNEVTGDWKSHTDSLSIEEFENDFVLDGNLFIQNYLIYKNVIPNASAVIFRKKSSYSEYLNIDKSLKYCGDWIFYFKMILNNKLAFVSKSYNCFRYHDNSVIATAKKEESRIRIIDIDFAMRSEFIRFLKNNKAYISNKILFKNQSIINDLKYEKSLILISKKIYISGFFVLLNVCFKNYKFRKKLRGKINSLFSYKEE